MIREAGSQSPDFRIDLAASPDFYLGDLRVRPARRQVCTADGPCRQLEPRVMQVLVALACAGDDVVSRDRLIETCWAGRIVGDDAINRCIVALRHLARDIEPVPFAIATVPRVGYYLIEGRSDGPGTSAARRAPAIARRHAPRLSAPAWRALLAGMFALTLFRLAWSRAVRRRGD